MSMAVAGGLVLAAQMSWKQRCAAGLHKYRGKEHAGGCKDEATSHMHVACRRCHWWWIEPMLFDPRPWNVAA